MLGLALALHLPAQARCRDGRPPGPRQDVHRPQDRALPLVARLPHADVQRRLVPARASRQPPAALVLRSAQRGRAEPRASTWRSPRSTTCSPSSSDGGDVAIYDATNSTRERRALVRARCVAAGLEVVFVESTCTDPAIVESNIRATKARSPDYEGVPEEEAVRDFRLRIAHYESGLRGGRRRRRRLRPDHRRRAKDGAPPHPGVPPRARRALSAQPARAAAQRLAHAPRRERVQRPRPHRRRRSAQRGRSRVRRAARERRSAIASAPTSSSGRARCGARSGPRRSSACRSAAGARSTRSTPASATG